MARLSLPKPLGRLPAAVRWGLSVVVGVAIAGAVLLVGFRSLRPGALPGLSVASVDVGGLEDEELSEAIRRAARKEAGRTVTVERTGPGAPERAEYRLEEMGYSIDVERTVEKVLERGRQSSPIAALGDHLRATFGGFTVAPVTPLEGDEFEGWLARAKTDLSERAFPGGIEFQGTEVETLAPETGIRVPRAALRREALGVLRGDRDGPIEVAGEPVQAATDLQDVNTVARKARRAVQGPITLTRGGERLSFTPEQIAGLLGTKVATGGEPKLVLTVDPKDAAALVEDKERFSEEPVDATFEVAGDGVRVVPSQPGFRFSAKKLAKQIVKVALSEAREAKMDGKEVAADFTTSDAKDLGVTEQVSTFTTYHSCCEPRVENIHRIADIVDGAIVEPGETFSLNDYVGPRTTDKGFVAAPAIRDGEFVPEVGGGISQFATTFFNAIFFGGYDFLEYQAHSYYISRYPRGREATISTPAPDLEFLNDSEHGIFIDTSYTDTSITVSFYGTSEFDIEAIMGEPFNVRPPKEECRVNRSLAKGESRTIQSGITGFDVVVKRVFEPGGKVEEFRTHYLAQPRIVERKKC